MQIRPCRTMAHTVEGTANSPAARLQPRPAAPPPQMGKMPDGKVMYTLDGRPVTEEPEGSPEEKHYKRIINQVGGAPGAAGARVARRHGAGLGLAAPAPPISLARLLA